MFACPTGNPSTAILGLRDLKGSLHENAGHPPAKQNLSRS